MSDFGDRLKEERLRMGLNQTEFGAIGGVKKGAQFNYEAGDRVPDADYLAKIAVAGADVAYILTGIRTPKPPAAIAEEGMEYRVVTKKQAAILDIIEDLDDKAVSQVQDVAENQKQIKEIKEELAKLRKKA
jgi:transcriptional regulator with XRE-family HTH domain